jgi:hypothetical protein
MIKIIPSTITDQMISAGWRAYTVGGPIQQPVDLGGVMEHARQQLAAGIQAAVDSVPEMAEPLGQSERVSMLVVLRASSEAMKAALDSLDESGAVPPDVLSLVKNKLSDCLVGNQLAVNFLSMEK